MTTTRKSLLPQQIAPVARNGIANPAGLRADSTARIAIQASFEQDIPDLEAVAGFRSPWKNNKVEKNELPAAAQLMAEMLARRR
ncbi:MAG: hypothetical protein AAF703_23000 [Cyanobacteria bacterium P01_D01_bin.105]